MYTYFVLCFATFGNETYRTKEKPFYFQLGIFMVLFISQYPPAFLTDSICLVPADPGPPQRKQSMLPCHLSMRSTRTIEACHLAY